MKKLVYLLAFAALISCRKGKVDYSRVIVAQYDLMDVQYQKVLISGNVLAPKRVELDLDQDGIRDLQFHSELDLTLKSLHDGCEFLIETNEDSVYSKESYQIQPDPNGTTAAIHLTKYSCQKETAQYTLNTLSATDELVPMIVGERFDRIDKYASGTFYFKRPALEEVSEVYTQNDTTYYNLTSVKNNCHQFPANDIYFIGVRLQTEDGPKLGWVKVQYLGGNAIRVFECAIQR